MDITKQQVKGYELKERLGAGGFGAVFRAYQAAVGREVAVKVILPSHSNQPEFIRRFEGEAQLVARLEHPHITPLYDFWRDTDGAYLVMRWLRGGSLKEALDKQPFDLQAAARLLEQVAGALSLAHRNEIIHRDIKPGNILLDEDGNAYLTDFGIAKDLNLPNGGTQADAIVGSLDYISPEQARSETVTARTDIYSLGVTMYEVITGKHPFEGLSSIERLYKHINDPLPEIRGFDPEREEAINRVIQKATQKNPEQRYPDALAFAAEFREAIGLNRRSTTIEELLTQREHDILALIIEGLSNKEIAQRLTISLSTVKWYVNQIYEKLGVRSRVQAIVRARELKLISKGESVAQLKPVATEDFYPENPYKGLRAFQTGDYQDFFGREKITAKLLKRLSEAGDYQRFLALVGPSGSGKSSLLKAGLIPALWRGEIPGSEKWFVVEMLPGARPFDELEIALMKVAANQAGSIHEQLHRDANGLLRIASLILPDEQGELLLVIDQFEEVFTLVENEAERTAFLNLLYASVTDPRSRLRIVMSLRADFYDRPLHYPSFGEVVRNRLETVMPLSAEELERAIRLPAERVGLSFEQGLVSSIVGDVNYQAGALPLLQYALTELFEQRQGRLLTRDAYQQIGRATGALAKRAEEIYLSLNEGDKELTRQIFLRLVTLGEGTEDTRRRTLRAELLGIQEDSEALEELLDTFGSYRLLSMDKDAASRQPTVEVAHEALIREWERLKAWLNESRAEIQMQRQLSSLASEWEQAKANKSFLLRGTRLQAFEEWAKNSSFKLTPVESHFLQSSLDERSREAEAERERQAREKGLERRSQVFLRALVTVFALASLISIGLAAFAIDGERQEQQARATSDANFTRAEQQRLTLLANDVMDSGASGNIGFALAVRSLQYGYSPEADEALLRATRQGFILRDFDRFQWNVTNVEYSYNGRFMIVASGESVTRVLDPDTLEEIHSLPQEGMNGIEDIIALSSNSNIIALLNNPDGAFNLVRLWNIETGEAIQEFSFNEMAKSFVISPDNQQLAVLHGNIVSVMDIATGAELQQYPLTLNDGTLVRSISYSAQGRLQALIQDASHTFLQDAETKEETCTFAQAPDTLAERIDVIVSKQGTRAITVLSNANTIIQTWDLTNCSPLLQFTAHDDPITYVSFDNTGMFLISSSMESGATFIQWEFLTGHEIRRYHDFDSTAARFSPDNQGIISWGGRALRFWDSGFPQEPYIYATDLIASNVVQYAPDGQSIYAGGLGNYLRFDLNNPLSVIHYDTVPVRNAAVSPDGKYLAVAVESFDTTSNFLLDAETGEILREFIGQEAVANWLAFSPDGTQLAASSVDGKARLWDVASGELLQEFVGHNGIVAGLRFAPNGQSILTTSTDGTARIWDIHTGEAIHIFDHEGAPLPDADFSPDGRLIVTSDLDGFAHIWDIETGEKLHDLAGHTDAVWSSRFSPDGTMVVTASFDGTARIWDVQTGELLRFYRSASYPSLFSAVFSPDGEYILAGEQGLPAIQLWRVDLDSVIAEVCRRDFVDLTTEQRQQYGITDTENTCDLWEAQR